MTHPDGVSAGVARTGLRRWTSCGGCGAKWPAKELRQIIASSQRIQPPEGLTVGLDPFDDAAVVQIGEEYLIATTDFFPPLVDDPYDYGAIAASNACSDVYAMGARVLIALSVAAFPEEFALVDVAAIMAGASDVVAQAGGAIVGGHTIRNPEPVFGLAVNGIATGCFFTKGGARPGDRLVMSKPLGTGLVLAANEPQHVATATAGMRSLNRAASEALVEMSDHVSAVTDVTGFGLLGHATEMAERTDCTFVIDGGLLPAYPGALDAAERGVRTGADERNRDYAHGSVEVATSAAVEALAYDPQTSGGLLAAVASSAVDALSDAGFVEVGEVVGPGHTAVRLGG